jgi:hypothetical protein
VTRARVCILATALLAASALPASGQATSPVAIFAEGGFSSILEEGLAAVYGGGMVFRGDHPLGFELRALRVDWSYEFQNYRDRRRQTLLGGGVAIEGRPDEMVRVLFSVGLGALAYRREVQDRTATGTALAPYLGTMMLAQASERLHLRVGGTVWIGRGDATASIPVALNVTAGLAYQF